MLKRPFFVLSSTAFLLCTEAHLVATALNVTTYTDANVATGGAPGELRYVLNTILDAQAQGTSSGNWQINFTGGAGTITLHGILPMINLFTADTVTFNPSPSITIDGNHLYRGFFVRQGNVTLQNMTLQNCLAQGGAGGPPTNVPVQFAGGGGGMGAG